jgi:hypothetical protein
MDVLVGGLEAEAAFVELALDPPQAALDGFQLGRRDDAGRLQTARVRDAACDVIWVELVVDRQ